MIQELFTKRVLVFGCGNSLFGDDGFGPAVIDHLTKHYRLPEFVCAMDAGTSIRDFLFDLILAPVKPSQIIIFDAVVIPHRRPGELFELSLDKIPINKTGDFSLHQFPSVNLLWEMNNLADVDVKVMAVQAAIIPDMVQPGLSPEVHEAIEPACRWLLDQFNKKEAKNPEPASIGNRERMKSEMWEHNI